MTTISDTALTRIKKRLQLMRNQIEFAHAGPSELQAANDLSKLIAVAEAAKKLDAHIEAHHYTDINDDNIGGSDEYRAFFRALSALDKE